MRSIGVAERAIEIMIGRGLGRVIEGTPLAQRGVVLEWIARSRIELDGCRLLVLNASHAVDTKGAKNSKKEIAMAKVQVPNTVLKIVDRAMQLYGASGLSQDTPLASMWAHARTLRIADGNIFFINNHLDLSTIFFYQHVLKSNFLNVKSNPPLPIHTFF